LLERGVAFVERDIRAHSRCRRTADAGATADDGGAVRDAPPAPGVSLTGFTAKSAAFRAARTTNDDGLLDIVMGDADDVCHAARTAKFTKCSCSDPRTIT